MKSIRPAMCRGHDKITYECRKCGYEKIYVPKWGPPQLVSSMLASAKQDT